MDLANTLVFLISPDFIASDECLKEWDYAKNMVSNGKVIFRIPVILRECPWEDFLGADDVRALPIDGKAISEFRNEDTAWNQVYEGIKAVVEELRNTFTPKEEFIKEIDRTEFISQSHLNLQDLFVFLPLTCIEQQRPGPPQRERILTSQEELLEVKYALVHGQGKAGKTALARHLCLSLIRKARPVLFVNLEHLVGRRDEAFSRAYQDQFNGDYSLWVQQDNKTLIIDNLTKDQRSINLIGTAVEIFECIIVTLSSDTFYSYFMDDSRLANFQQLKLEPLSNSQQENLIRKRLSLSNSGRSVTDGFIDQVERRVNSVTISKKLLPRYPFFILSILQAFEAYMPSNMAITSYGHCYHILIVANLRNSGISLADDAINTCFNFAEHLAFRIREHNESRTESSFDFHAFLKQYQQRFIIKDSIVKRLQDPDYGLIDEFGTFRTKYMYYYFLGKFLAGNSKEGASLIDTLCNESFKEENHLSLLFTIHHTNDNSIIENILERTKRTLDDIPPAVLSIVETKKFQGIIEALPKEILSKESVETERRKERERRDNHDDNQLDPLDNTSEVEEFELVNGIYRILKNNKLLGQVLRNKHGNLEKPRIEEIIENIADSGLRLVNLVLEDESEIGQMAHFLHQQNPELDFDKIKKMLQTLSFLWTMVNVEAIVDEINIPEIREAVTTVVTRRSTPAFDLIGYFSQLDGVEELTKREYKELAGLFKQHEDEFIKWVLSFRTQAYMNTHRSRETVEKPICALLKIVYRPKRLPGC